MANKEEINNKVPGMSIAALVLGIVSIVFWCVWFISIPCSILGLIFGILGIKKARKGFALTGIITGGIALAIWAIIMTFAFMYGFIEGIAEYDYDDYIDRKPSHSYHSSIYDF